MLVLTPQQFQQRLEKHAQELSKLIQDDLPIIIGKMAVDHFKLNFQNEAWGREKWQEVKRRLQPSKKGYQRAGKRRKILSGDTGQLGRSIQYTPESGKVTIHSDLIYSAVHNYGLRAGKGRFRDFDNEIIKECILIYGAKAIKITKHNLKEKELLSLLKAVQPK